MTSLVNVDTKGHRYWLKSFDGHFQEIGHRTFADLKPGAYEITSVEPKGPPPPTPHIPPIPFVKITNVGQETIHLATFGKTITLPENGYAELIASTYLVASTHIPPL